MSDPNERWRALRIACAACGLVVEVPAQYTHPPTNYTLRHADDGHVVETREELPA